MPSLEAARHERWVQWWCAPWQWAHPDWLAVLTEHSGLSDAQASRLLPSRHGAFLKLVGITPSQPPPPSEPLLQWLMLDIDQQRQALSLAQSICLGRDAEQDRSVHEDWCRAVARALRPGAWLAPDMGDPRHLLAAWLGEECWSRLRLSWPRDALRPSFIHLPENKLQTLWQAVLWRVTTG